MKRSLVFIVKTIGLMVITLSILTNNAWAEWVKVGATVIFASYADPSTIQKTANGVKMWSAMDFYTPKTAFGKQFQSIKSQHEFDCAGISFRALYVRSYSLKMGDGYVVETSNETRPWVPVSPESIDELLWKFACKK